MRALKRFFTNIAVRSSAIAYHISFDASMLVGTSEVIVPVIRGMGLQHLTGNHEEGVRRLIAWLLKEKPGTFVDVGANIGQTLIKVAACDRNRRYLGFEVQPLCIGYLARLIAANSLSHFRMFPIGLFSRSGLVDLSCDSPADPGATVLPNLRAKAYSASFPVFVETGDDFFRMSDEDAIAVIKIDVEGAELQVLRGLEHTLSKYEPCLLLEILPTRHLKGQSSLAPHSAEDLFLRRNENNSEIRRLTKRLGYQSFRILEDGWLEPDDEFEMVVYDQAAVNYLFAVDRDLPLLAGMLRS